MVSESVSVKPVKDDATDLPALTPSVNGVSIVVASSSTGITNGSSPLAAASASELSLNAPQLRLVTAQEPWEQTFLSVLCKRTSSLPVAGYGVFATAVIPAKQKILKYHGVLLDRAAATKKFAMDANDIPHDNMEDWRYVFRLSTNKFIDASAKEETGLAHLINHNWRALCNCRFSAGRAGAYVVTTKNIQPGDELFTDYGEEFSSFIKNKLKALGARMLTEAEYLVIRETQRAEHRLHGNGSHTAANAATPLPLSHRIATTSSAAIPLPPPQLRK